MQPFAEWMGWMGQSWLGQCLSFAQALCPRDKPSWVRTVSRFDGGGGSADWRLTLWQVAAPLAAHLGLPRGHRDVTGLGQLRKLGG